MRIKRHARWIGLAMIAFAVNLGEFARAQTMLATWDTAPVSPPVPGTDFDPQFDYMQSCSGCWFASVPATDGTTYSHSTAQSTQGSGSLQASIVGKGRGGEYTANINGAPVQLDTHFDDPLSVIYSNNPVANGGVLDPRYTALYNAVSGANPGSFYTIDFDIIYDVDQMRSIAWQAPEETVDPETNGQFPQRYFWVGMRGDMSNDLDGNGFAQVLDDANHSPGDPYNINPFDAQYDTNPFPVFQASFLLDDFDWHINPENPPTLFRFDIVYNSVFGTLPAASNTHGVNIYFDNFRLVEHDPTDSCDFNDDSACTLADFELFMAQHLTAEPTLGDYDGDGDNDFLDFQEFETFYDLANLGSGSLQAHLAGVPEPGSIFLFVVGMLALALARVRRRARASMLLAAGLAVALAGQQSADAQVIETWTTLGNWVPNPGAPAQAAPSIELSSVGATDGTTSLKVTQADDTLGNDDFVWMTTTTPNWVDGDPAFEALANAVNIGAEHFNVVVDVTFRPQDLADQGVNSLTMTLGLNFNGQTVGTYAGETTQFTNTATIPLTAFNLPDVEDQGATSYSAQVGFTADALGGFPFSAYIDNLHLDQISTPDLLTLEIDRSSGSAILKNLSANPISWDYMEIKSPGASLDPSGWSSLDDQNVGGPGNWIEAGGSSPTALVEASIVGDHTLGAGEMLPLGNLYNNGINAEDVDLEIRRVGGPSFRTYDQLVTYIGTAPMGVAGDYNDNGTVDAADYVLWRAGGPLQNEGASPGVVDGADYTFWRSRFGATSGSGSGGSLQAGAVPEPATVVLLLSALVAWRGALGSRGA